MGLPQHLLNQIPPEERARVIEGAKKHADAIDEATAERRWVDVLHLQDRNNGPALLNQWWEAGDLTVDDLRSVIPEAWVGAEWPVPHLGERKWLRLFREAGYVYRWTSDAPWQGDISTPPTSAVTVYRGAPTWTKGRGMSWSLELARAEWFADRWASWGIAAAVYQATVPPRAVLAMFNDRAEQEVVVNPNMLRARISVIRALDVVSTVEHAVFGTVRLH